MGCDYYIDKDLHIYDHNNTIFSYINLEHERGYYWFVSLLDEDGYHNELSQYIKNKLEPSMKPIIIYNNNTFVKLSYENKYKKNLLKMIYTLEDLKCRFYSIKKYSRFARCRACKLWFC